MRDAAKQNAFGTCLACLCGDDQPGGEEAGGGEVLAVQLRGGHLLPLLPLRCLAVPHLQHLTHEHMSRDIQPHPRLFPRQVEIIFEPHVDIALSFEVDLDIGLKMKDGRHQRGR